MDLDRFDCLAELYLEDNLTDDEARELCEALESTPELRDELLSASTFATLISVARRPEAEHLVRSVMNGLRSARQGEELVEKVLEGTRAHAQRSRRRAGTATRRAVRVTGRRSSSAVAVATMLGIAAVLVFGASLMFRRAPTTRRERVAARPASPEQVHEEPPRTAGEEVPPAVSDDQAPPVRVVGPKPEAIAHADAHEHRPSPHPAAVESMHPVQPDAEPGEGAGDAVAVVPPGEPAAFVAYVDYIDGPCERSSRDGTGAPAQAGMGLLVGDTLTTDRARALVVFESGSALAMNRFTTIVFSRTEPVCTVDVTGGSIVASVAPGDVGFTVETHHGRAIDLGTTFAVSVTRHTGSTVLVVDGAVAASTEAGTVVVDANWDVNLRSRDTAPGAARYVHDVERRLAWASPLPGYAECAARHADLNDGLIGYWPLNEGRGGIAHNSSRSKFAGRIVGPKWTEGRIGGALEFDGHDDAVIIPTGRLALVDGEVSIALWAWSSEPVAQFGRGLATIGITDTRGCQFLTSKGKLDWHFFGRDGELDKLCLVTRGGAPLRARRWYHFTITCSDKGDRVRTYVDGKLDRERHTHAAIPRLPGPIIIGGRRPVHDTEHEAWLGKLDEIRVYDRELTPDEVARLAAQPARRP